MNPRLIPAVMLALIFVPLFIFGSEQYAYAFIGLLTGLGALAIALGAESPVWMMIFPLAVICIMIAYSAAALVTTVYLIVQILARPKFAIRFRSGGVAPLVFAISVVLGLLLLSNFPTEPPIQFSNLLFLGPILLFSVSAYHFAKVQ